MSQPIDPEAQHEKHTRATASDPEPEASAGSRDELHIVDRNDDAFAGSGGKTHIAGYDAELMAARVTLNADEERRLLRRIDWHLLPLLAVMYMVKTIDAANVSNARIMDKGTPRNIMTELGISANGYNLVTTAYYVPYILAETPSNLLLKKVSPSVWQARIMISWGVVLCTHAALTNAGGLYVVRALLGLFEAGLWPGQLVQMCYWYRPDELAPRIVWVTLLGNFSSVVSGLLAFAFDGVTTGGLSGWKW